MNHQIIRKCFNNFFKLIVSSTNKTWQWRLSSSSPFTEDEDDAACIFCVSLFSNDCCGEKWIRCIMCMEWAHGEYAGYSAEKYICDFCK